MYVHAPAKILAEVGASICSKGDERPPHAPLTCSHHHRHHRLPLIETLPLWLTLRLPAYEGEEGWENNLELRRTEFWTRMEQCKPDWEGCRDATKEESCKVLQLVCIMYHTKPRHAAMCDEKCLVETSSGLFACLHSWIWKWNIGISCI